MDNDNDGMIYPTSFYVPKLDGTVVAACDDKLGIELKAGHSRLVLIGA